jgi:hypothetical protein
MDPYLRSWLLFVRWLVEVAPSERAFLEGFLLDIYTARERCSAGSQPRNLLPACSPQSMDFELHDRIEDLLGLSGNDRH